MTNIILTGVSGSIGQAVIQICKELEIKTTNFPLPRYLLFKNRESEFYQDLRDQIDVNARNVFLHLGHPGIFASSKTYEIYRRNSLILFEACKVLKLPLIFASSASCFEDNTSFYSRFKYKMEGLAISKGHKVIRLGIFIDGNDLRSRYHKMAKLYRLAKFMGLRARLNEIGRAHV